MENQYKIAADFAEKCHAESNCTYNGLSYMVHVKMVVGMVSTYRDVFVSPTDAVDTILAAYCHDIIEDARKTYNDINDIVGKNPADIVLAVTDVPAENRLMRHLLTMGKTVKDHRAIILKMCDIWANATYSKGSGSSMYAKYVEEYQYRRPIFMKALTWYSDELYSNILKRLWEELDSAHGFNK